MVNQFCDVTYMKVLAENFSKPGSVPPGMDATTPKFVSKVMKKALSKLGAKMSDLKMDIPVIPSKESENGKCYNNAYRYVKQNPEYETVCGHALWQTVNGKGVLTEHHCIVRCKKTGKFIDISPSLYGEPTIWFVPNSVNCADIVYKMEADEFNILDYSGEWHVMNMTPTQFRHIESSEKLMAKSYFDVVRVINVY
jgi:hypothetical protein